jgi:hypothetical protein
MFDIIPYPGYAPTDRILQNSLIGITMAFKGIRRNGSWQYENGPEAFHTNFASIGAGATTALWTPAGTAVICLNSLVIMPTAAIASLQILNNAVVVYDFNMAANEKLVLNFGYPGIYWYPQAAVLNVKNNTAGAVTVNITAYGSEPQV